MFHKLWVGEIHRSRIVLIERGDGLHFVVGKGKIKDIEILLHALTMRALGYSHNASLSEPAQCHLSGTLAIILANTGKQVALDNTVHSLSAKWSPCHHASAKVVEQRLNFLLLDERIALQLVNHRLDVDIVSEVEEARLLEV